MIKIFIFWLLFFIPFNSSFSENLSAQNCLQPFPAELNSIIQKTFNELPDPQNAPGMVVAIYHPMIGFAQQAYGMEQPEKKIAMRTDRVFDIGSVMKHFRWVILQQLIAQGVISLGDPINFHIQNPVLNNRKISDLMLHSTGMIDIPDSAFFSDVVPNNLAKTYTYPEMLNFFVQATNLKHPSPFQNGLTLQFEVGKDFRYSSFGPLIAGEIARLITGKPITDLIQEKILTPLNLTHTQFMYGKTLPAYFAQGYVQKAGAAWIKVRNIPNTEGVSSGFGRAMYSTACDLVRYTQQNSTTFLTMSQTYNPIFGGAAKVGLGVFNYGSAWGEGFWGHLGANVGHGHSSAIAHRNSDSLSVVVLANIDPAYNQYGTQFRIIKAIGEYFKE